MVSLVIIVEAAAGKAENFLKYITEEAAEVIANEAGCLQFMVSRSMENPGIFTLAEFYVDEEAIEAHRQTPHFLLFQERVSEFGLIANKNPILGDVIFPFEASIDQASSFVANPRAAATKPENSG